MPGTSAFYHLQIVFDCTENEYRLRKGAQSKNEHLMPTERSIYHQQAPVDKEVVFMKWDKQYRILRTHKVPIDWHTIAYTRCTRPQDHQWPRNNNDGAVIPERNEARSDAERSNDGSSANEHIDSSYFGTVLNAQCPTST